MRLIKKQIEISLVKLIRLSVAYIYVPIAFMILGWCRLVYAIPCILFTAFSVTILVKRLKSEKKITMSNLFFFMLCLLVLFTGLICGWGGFFPQSYDWSKHNALFRDMITKKWPVIYENHGTRSMLTYYIAQYIVPAVAGKMFSFFMPQNYNAAFFCGELIMFIWNSVGLLLVVLHVVVLTETNKPIITLILLIFFGSLLPIGRALITLFFDQGTISNVTSINELDLHNLNTDLIGAQYTTNFVQLRWVFPQCIVAWMVTAMLMEGILGVENYAVIGLPVILFSSFPFLGLIPFMFVDIIKNEKLNEHKYLLWLKDIFSVQNIFALLSLGSFSLLYFWGYIFTENKPDILKLAVNDYTIPAYIIFVLSTFGIYMLLLIPAVKTMKIFKMRYFISAGIILLILPLYRMGLYNDFTMRVSIPALFVLCVVYIKSLLSEEVRKKRKYWFALSVFFWIGISYPAMELIFVVTQNRLTDHQELADGYVSMEYYANPDLEKIEPNKFNKNQIDILYNYYTYEDDMRYFINTIGKREREN